MYIFINTRLINFQNCFGTLSRLCHGKTLKQFIISNVCGATQHCVGSDKLCANYRLNGEGKGKVKFTLEQGQRGSRCIDLLFLQTRR